jgi:ribose 5-phosphate isomerase B
MIPGIRSAICHDSYSANQGVEHDDMNVLTLGSRIIGEELAKELVRDFLNAQFSKDERHVRRLNKVKQIEADYLKR